MNDWCHQLLHTLLMQIAMFQTKLFRSVIVIVGFFFLKEDLCGKLDKNLFYFILCIIGTFVLLKYENELELVTDDINSISVSP